MRSCFRLRVPDAGGDTPTRPVKPPGRRGAAFSRAPSGSSAPRGGIPFLGDQAAGGRRGTCGAVADRPMNALASPSPRGSPPAFSSPRLRTAQAADGFEAIAVFCFLLGLLPALARLRLMAHDTLPAEAEIGAGVTGARVVAACSPGRGALLASAAPCGGGRKAGPWHPLGCFSLPWSPDGCMVSRPLRAGERSGSPPPGQSPPAFGRPRRPGPRHTARPLCSAGDGRAGVSLLLPIARVAAFLGRG